MKKYILIALLSFFCNYILLAQPTVPAIKPIFGSITDYRDGKVYKTIKLGNKFWMAYNLNYNIPGSWCYEDSLDYCKTYGRLYSLEAAQKVCPPGWHLPSDTDWVALVNTLGGKKIAGGLMKEEENIHWEDPNFGATNQSGFRALPAGFRSSLTDQYLHLGSQAYFWSSTPVAGHENFYWYLFLDFDSDAAFIENITITDKNFGYSVRCMRN
jgi:uncharacterized protein (TIGR02145 family)